MNLLILLAIAVGGVLLLWAAQCMAQRRAGEPLTPPLRYRTQSPLVKWTGRIMIQLTWLGILLAFPLAIGSDPSAYYGRALSGESGWRQLWIGFAVMFLAGAVSVLLGLAFGWMRVQVNHPPRRFWRKFFDRIRTAATLPVMEEAVFRAVLLEQVVLLIPATFTWRAAAVAATAAIFSVMHFLRPRRPGLPLWQPMWGLFLVGCLFGAAYLHAGRTLWLPIGLHAGAILICQWARLTTKHTGPPWLVGYGEHPQSGVVGFITILIVAAAVCLWL